METIYVITPGVSIHLKGGHLVIEQNHEIIREIPILIVGNLIVGRTVQISTQVMFSLAKQGSMVQFVDYKYQLIGTFGNGHTALSKLLWQVNSFQDESFSLCVAQYIVQRKIEAQLSVIQQYKKSRSTECLSSAQQMLKAFGRRIRQSKTVDSLRGIEGLASKTYFSVWPSLLSDTWNFTGRKKYPSTDPVNAILSYGYSFLEREVRCQLVSSGLDVRIGVLHSSNNRKDSFVYDVMDLFRQDIVDRMILKMMNLHMLGPDDFMTTEDRCVLKQDVHKKWLNMYELYMNTEQARLSGYTPRDWVRIESATFLKFLNEIEVVSLVV